jgi:hypothetical protein
MVSMWEKIKNNKKTKEKKTKGPRRGRKRG